MASETDGETPPRAERRDRARNREKLLDAARAVFTASGIHAPLDHVATAAGVGAGTLYRHFPSRAALWEALLKEPLGHYLDAVESALAEPDPWGGFSAFAYAICEMDAQPGSYPDLLNTRFDAAPELNEIRGRIQRGITRIFRRAHSAGVLRADVTAEDLFFLILSNAAVRDSTRAIAPDVWRRNVALYLDAFRPGDAPPLPSPPLTAQQLAEIVAPAGV